MDKFLLKWIFSAFPNFPLEYNSWTKVIDAENTFLPEWNSPSYNKVLGHKLPSNLDLGKTTIIGGICSIFTAEAELIRNKELVFENIEDFEKWIYSWYPRIDQIHDVVGIPPKLCRKIIYVCEDSLFAQRIYLHTKLPREQLQKVLKEVHIKQGHPVLCNWLKHFGYNGLVEVVYTSDLDKELNVGVKFWERLLGGHFQNKYQACAELMYTAIWLDILKIKNVGVIYEPANHMYYTQPKFFENWAINNKMGVGFNHNLGIISYFPFWSASGLSRLLPLEKMPHYGNYKTYHVSDEDLPWYIVNLLFDNKEILAADPATISKDKIIFMINSILNKCYSFEQHGELHGKTS